MWHVHRIVQNSDMFWTPTLAVQSDVATFVQQLATELGSSSTERWTEWIDTLRRRDDETETKNAYAHVDTACECLCLCRKMALDKPDAHLNTVAVCMALEQTLPDDCILVADGGDFVGTAAYTIRFALYNTDVTRIVYRPRGPLQWLDPGAFGTLGVGGGFALGAALAVPGHPVCILYGDGSLGYSLIEYDTYKRHKVINVTNVQMWNKLLSVGDHVRSGQ
jgi:acetolactate synthase-like protein